MATRTVRDPRGYTWTIRERWLHPVGGLPANGLADDFEVAPRFLWPFAIVGALSSLLVWLLRLPLSLLRLAFAAPLIEAERAGEPHVKMTWRADDRQVGPKVIDELEHAIRSGNVTTDVAGARFIGFDDLVR